MRSCDASCMKRVLIVDDYEPNLRLYAAVVKRVTGEEPLAYEEPRQALERLRTTTVDLIILDYQMPELNGIDLVRAVRELPEHVDTPVIFVTSDSDPSLPARALSSGATVFLEKPVALRDFMAHIRRFVPAPVKDEIPLDGTSGDRDAIVRLHRALQARDANLAERIRRARDLAVALAHDLDVSSEEIERLTIAALVYDIGMIAVPDKALEAPWELNARWTNIVREHAGAGSVILSGGNSPLMEMAEMLARLHHERFDGEGYPERRKGEQIPLLARIIAVADAFTAMTSERPYRVEMATADAIAAIKAESSGAFDPLIVGALASMRDPLVPALRTA